MQHMTTAPGPPNQPSRAGWRLQGRGGTAHAIRARPRTPYNVRFIRFDYNAGEVNELRRYAERMRYTFEVIEGNSHPKSDLVRKSITEANLKKAVQRGNANRTLERRDEVCALIFDQFVIDCVGDIYLCCSFIESAALKQLAAPVWSV
jgi:hypothetical protein